MISICYAAIFSVAACAGLMLSGAAALADREPTADERARIENVLRSQGFTQWEDIELEDDGWEVDDARTADGQEQDLKLHRDSLEIIERDR